MVDSSLPPDISALLERIDEIRPLIEKNAAQGEAERRVSQESIDALEAIGAFRVTQPAKYGGYEGDSRAQVDVGAAVGKGDGGTAWVVALTNIANWLTALYPEKAQDDVWGEDRNAKVSVVLATNGKTQRVDGGYLVSGEWSYNSASWHTQWAILGAELVDENGDFVDTAQLLIPRSDLGFKDIWHVAGMRSSGSNALSATDVFVPDHRVMRGEPALRGTYPGTTEDTPAVYRAGWIPVLNIILVGPQLGMGRAVLERVISKADSKAIAYTSFERQSDSIAFQLDIAKAALLLEAAEGFAHRATDEIDIPAAQGVYPDYLTRARNRAYVGWIVEHTARAIEMLLTAHGSGAFAEVNPLQRLWRDQAVASRHAFVLPALGYELYGKALLGREDGDSVTPLV
ncbi:MULTISPECIES: acyl-CoA dehydrogenase family protein [Micrococcales]|uniref:Oxidoreductase n=2 Tax=Micrococcales TaxID=85006 RepID=A0AAX3EJ03_PAEUR|nr:MULTISPECIES: acyl-CoA dehydrogenase family protein [Micrococcales]NKR13420.1 oxidoreductase [Arthrobacter sp. M5]NKR15231.1 oxidoreductase [Arthrobacter sp. M6]OEH61723.1 oxidoreductase [Arthrobacter sp. D2]CDJ99309.1 putative oxidoreductase [Microbacterium sp. C448]MDO5862918.1 oxidoreductase [Paenarthrobacter sp. SD-2]